MTEREMSKALKALSSDYEPVLKYLSADSIEDILSGYLEIFRWFLRGLPLSRIICKLNFCGDLEESRTLAKELKSPEDFLEEAKDMIDCFLHCRVIRTTDLSRLAELEAVAVQINEEENRNGGRE